MQRFPGESTRYVRACWRQKRRCKAHVGDEKKERSARREKEKKKKKNGRAKNRPVQQRVLPGGEDSEMDLNWAGWGGELMGERGSREQQRAANGVRRILVGLGWRAWDLAASCSLVACPVPVLLALPYPTCLLAVLAKLALLAT